MKKGGFLFIFPGVIYTLLSLYTEVRRNMRFSALYRHIFRLNTFGLFQVLMKSRAFVGG